MCCLAYRPGFRPFCDDCGAYDDVGGRDRGGEDGVDDDVSWSVLAVFMVCRHFSF
jgi:hypothetical protein